MEQIFTGASSLLVGLMVILTVVAWWIIFQKAGRKGIWSIVPVVNILIMAEIALDNKLYGLLYFVPLVNFVLQIYIYYRLFQRFGYDGILGVVAVFFPFLLFLPAFSDARYH
ncbi:MAG: DUF5684 domain-containing protein [Tissierellia bacterium]|nr:DUF5684 domain-containing protein [Tissierellia bacterium]